MRFGISRVSRSVLETTTRIQQKAAPMSASTEKPKVAPAGRAEEGRRDGDEEETR